MSIMPPNQGVPTGCRQEVEVVISHGNELNVDRKGEVLVCGRDWGQHEEDQERPFVGPAGWEFDEVLPFGGFRREDINITNVVQEHRPAYDEFHNHPPQRVEEGRANLDKLVKRLKPKLIITLGNEAAYHFIEGWPTSGRGIYGAKGIEDRRGYFWETRYGWVLTLLHPAGALRKIVPGHELLCRDFRRARKWLRGKLPREEFPEVHPLYMGPPNTFSSAGVFSILRDSKVLAFDIETRFGHQVFCCGFCGDSLQPYVAKYGNGFEKMERLLCGQKGQKGVAHNGPYDVDILDRAGFSTALYTDDTQTAWGNALEPELAFRDEGEGKGRLTRKGLSSLASLDPGMNLPYWKEAYPRYKHPEWVSGYPDEDAEDGELDKLYTMGGRDAYVTRRLWGWLWPLVVKQGVEGQYRLAFDTNLCCITMTRRGWRVNEPLRVERMETLDKRAEEAKQVARDVGLLYIEKHEIKDFEWVKQCWCCNGVGDRCWRCAGLKAMPGKKAEYEPFLAMNNLGEIEDYTVAELKEILPGCETCAKSGERRGYDFNPYSGPQLRTLLYEHVGAPKWVFKGKEKMDEMAQLRMLLWSEGRK